MIDTVGDAPVGSPALVVEMFNGNESLGVLRLRPAGDKTALATSTRFRHPLTVSKAPRRFSKTSTRCCPKAGMPNTADAAAS